MVWNLNFFTRLSFLKLLKIIFNHEASFIVIVLGMRMMILLKTAIPYHPTLNIAPFHTLITSKGYMSVYGSMQINDVYSNSCSFFKFCTLLSYRAVSLFNYCVLYSSSKNSKMRDV